MKRKAKNIRSRLVIPSTVALGVMGVGILSSFVSTPANSVQEYSKVVTHEAIEGNDSWKALSNQESAVEIPSINDTSAKTLILGTNYIRLNNKVIYEEETRSLKSVAILGVYTDKLIAVQEIVLPAGYNQLSAINTNDITQGIVVSSFESTEAFYYGVDVKNKCLDTANVKSVTVPKNSYSVGANIDKKDEFQDENQHVIVSSSVAADKTNSSSYMVNVTITYIEDGSTNVIEELKTQISSEYNRIKLIDSYAIDSSLYFGLNFYNQSDDIVGSQLFLLKNGQQVPGGPSILLPLQINSMVYDKEHNSLYVQYLDRRDNVLRMWGYDTGSPDKFAQLGAIPNGNTFNQMVVIPGEGVASLTKDKKEVRLFQFQTGSLISAPDFNVVKNVYGNHFMKTKSAYISDLVYNPNTKAFSLFYSYNSFVDGIITWTDLKANSTESYYTNIAPVHINYADMLTKMNEDKWINKFASVYAQQHFETSFEEFLVIPQYYKTIQTNSILNSDDSFKITYDVNENLGLFNLNVEMKDVQTEEVTNLVNFNVRGFEKVNPKDIYVNYDMNSSLLSQTPTELEAMLNDPETAELTRDRIFELFGINKRYSALPYEIQINGYNVLGQIDIKISFPTVSVQNQDVNPKFIANQSATDLVTSQLSFENQFKLMVERWFIPVMVVVSLVALFLILLAVWFAIGRKLYRNYLEHSEQKLVAEYESLNILTDSDEAIQDNFGNIRNPMAMLDTTAINVEREQKVRFREELAYINNCENQKRYENVVKKGLSGFHKSLMDNNNFWNPQMLLTTPIND